MPKICPAQVGAIACGRSSAEFRFLGEHCHHHGRQQRNGIPFTVPRAKRSPSELQVIRESGQAHCRGCERDLPLSEFELSSHGTPRLDCRDCRSATHVRNTYNLSPDDLFALLQLQEGKCALCGSPDAGYGRRWHIDHNHDCCPGEKSCGACVRGALCLTCNAKGLPWYEGLPKELQTIEAINNYLANPPGLRLAGKEAP